jgi:hypothetical protein
MQDGVNDNTSEISAAKCISFLGSLIPKPSEYGKVPPVFWGESVYTYSDQYCTSLSITAIMMATNDLLCTHASSFFDLVM